MTAPRPGLAVGLMVTATAFIAATTLLAKALGTDALGPPLPAFQVTFGRFLFGAVAIGAVAALLRPTLTLAHAPLQLGRVACGWTGVTLMFAAAASIPLAEATAISFLNPVVAMILAIPVLGERVGRVRWTAAAIAIAGGLLLLRPGAAAVAPGAVLAFGAALALGSEVLFMKRLTRVEGALSTLVWSNGVGLLVSCVAALPGWQAPTAAQWLAMGALGALMACAQGCFINALMRADASFITPFSYLTLVFAGLYDAAIFGVVPDAVGWTGAGLVILGAALLAWREGRLHRRATPPAPLSPPSAAQDLRR